MARGLNQLTAGECKAAKCPAGRKQAKLYDGGGLVLVVRPDGRKTWQLRYTRPNGKATAAGLGSYPETTLATAREKRDEYRALLAKGIDPVASRRAERQATRRAHANDFASVAAEWWDTVYRKKVTDSQAKRQWRRLEQHAFPEFGRRPVSEIEPPIVLEALRKVERTGRIETAVRVKSAVSAVMKYAIATARAKRDPTLDLQGMLATPRANHYPAIVDPTELGAVLRAVDGYRGQYTTRAALQLLPMLFCRPGELRNMTWGSLDLEAGTWTYTVSKGGEGRVTPLPPQAVAILESLDPITGRGPFVFPSGRTSERPMSENTLSAALKRMDYGGEMVAHGFRAAARTILVERLGYSAELVEFQLGHAVRDMHGRSYNRAHWMEQRRDMLRHWASYLDELRDGGGAVTPIRGNYR